MKTAVVGEELLVLAFELAGVHRSFQVHGSEEAGEAVLALMEDTDIGLIVIQDSVAATIEPLLEKIRAEPRVFPLIMECPGPAGRGLREDRFTRSIQRLAEPKQIGGEGER